MARDKAKDDIMFNCSQEHELDQVAGNYDEHKAQVKMFLRMSCNDNSIYNSTHKQVYELIRSQLGYPVPV